MPRGSRNPVTVRRETEAAHRALRKLREADFQACGDMLPPLSAKHPSRRERKFLGSLWQIPVRSPSLAPADEGAVQPAVIGLQSRYWRATRSQDGASMA